MALSFVVLLMFFYFNCLIHLILFLSFSDFCSCSMNTFRVMPYGVLIVFQRDINRRWCY